MTYAYAIGVDLGGTKLNVGAVDASGKVKERIIVPTDIMGGSDAIIKQILELIRNIQTKIGGKPAAVGLGIAGQIDAQTGNVYFAPNLKWHNVPIKATLQQELDLPIAVTNDVRAAAWGEWNFGAGKNCQDFVCVFLGTGIGGGVVSGGRMLSGNSNSAAEIGHIVIAFENGRSCFCGLLSLAGSVENIAAKTVAEAFNNGDFLALEVVKEAGEALIAGAVTIVNSFNPKKLIFGGGITKGFPKLIEMAKEGVMNQALKAAVKDLQIEEAQILSDAGIVGAATFAWQTI
jgi:glucokinase